MPCVDAVIAAGYSKNRDTAKSFSASLNAYPEVQKRIDWLASQRADMFIDESRKAAEELGLSKKWVLQRLVDTYNMAITGEPILNSEGMQVGTRQNLSAANKSLEMIGKELGMFSDRVKVSGDENGAPIQLQAVPPTIVIESLRDSMMKRIGVTVDG